MKLLIFTMTRIIFAAVAAEVDATIEAVTAEVKRGA